MMVDEALCQKFTQLTESESVRNTSMWLGSHVSELQPVYVLSDEKDRLVKTELEYPPSIINVFMEQVANALDQRNEHPLLVTSFQFEFSNGIVSIYNNGPSIPVAKVRDRDGSPVWIPEMLCSKFLSGSNHDKSKAKTRITLGAHGIGLKAVASMSKKMVVECVDRNISRGSKYYYQEFLNNNTKVMPPVIEKHTKAPKEIRKGGTRFTYHLDYDHYANLPKNIMNTLYRIIEARVYQVAGYSKIPVRFNGSVVPVNSPKKLATMYFGEESYITMKLKHPEWDLDVFVAHPTGKLNETLSIINGGFITSGIHFKYIIDHIASDLKSRVIRYLKDKTTWRRSLVADNLSILIIGSIPDLIFSEQIKSDLKMKNGKSYFAQFQWPKTYAAKVWKILELRLGSRYIKAIKTIKTSRNIVNKNKYYPARKLKTSESDLLAFEGDSAQSSAKIAMADPKNNFNRDTKGMFLLGGVPINVRKHINVKKVNGKEIDVFDKILTNNVVWNDFMTAMNLRYGVDYSNPKEFATLNYHRYTNVVDKDHHGMGKIAAIMISNICYFWPELVVKTGFLGYMDTPIIRAFPPKKSKDKKVLEFMNDEEFRLWCVKKFGSDEVSRDSGWRIKYYKGLGTHSEKQCRHMFGNYDKLRVSYIDEQGDAESQFQQYFGKDSSPRKILLSTPPTTIPHVPNRSMLSISLFLDHYTKGEQQYNLLCKLNHWCDNMILGHRRMVEGLIDHLFNKGNVQQKVDQLAGALTAAYKYHHGQSSAEGMLVFLAQEFVGARNIPLSMPLSQHGTRFKANDDAAARYLITQSNPILKTIFPKEDHTLLKYMIEEGSVTIPYHMVPVIPLSILETNNLPGTGWAINKWARHIDDVMTNIELKLKGKQLVPMRHWLPNWNGVVRVINGHEWCVGTYIHEENSSTIIITELPFGEKNHEYIYGAKKSVKTGKYASNCLYGRDLIKHSTIKDESETKSIHIELELVPGAMALINEKYGNDHFTPLEDYLMLKKKMNRNLNFMDDLGNVRCYDSYEAIFNDWFVERRNLYPKRFRRRIVILELIIEINESKLKFINISDSLNLKKKSEREQDAILQGAGFIKFNESKIKNPGAPTDRIRSVVFGSGASYNYVVNMSYKAMSDEAVNRISKIIENAKKEINELRSPQILETTWISEAKKAISEIHRGHSEGWVPDDYEYPE